MVTHQRGRYFLLKRFDMLNVLSRYRRVGSPVRYRRKLLIDTLKRMSRFHWSKYLQTTLRELTRC